MKTVEHIHDCTGPDMRCACGYELRIAPISMSIEVFYRKRELVNDAFSTDSVDVVIARLERAIRTLRGLGR